MKWQLTLLFSLISINMLAQKKTAFIYELTLYESHKHRAMWSDREREVQQEHINYLDSLEAEGKLLIAGIIDQNLEDHTGFVVLTVDSYEDAFEIVQGDPSIKDGMMSARLRPLNIYFQKIE